VSALILIGCLFMALVFLVSSKTTRSLNDSIFIIFSILLATSSQTEGLVSSYSGIAYSTIIILLFPVVIYVIKEIKGASK
jgi:hypothetical protein